MTIKTSIIAGLRSLQRMVSRAFCKHALAWMRNIHGDEINETGCRTIWICEKCGKLKYDRDYFSRDMAVKVYAPQNDKLRHAIAETLEGQ